jgi:hypothetical protein
MASRLDLFRTIRDAIDELRARAASIEHAVARAQIYSEVDALREAAIDLQALQSCALSLRTKLRHCGEGAGALEQRDALSQRRKSRKNDPDKAPQLSAQPPSAAAAPSS